MPFFWKIACILLSRAGPGLWNVTYLGPSAELLYFENQIATFVGIWEKLLLFETQSATFLGISKKLLLEKSTNLV